MEKKPIVFEGACVFSILGSSIGFLTMLLAALFFRSVAEKIVMLTNYTSADRLSPLYFALLMVSNSISLAGVIKLYHTRRWGLYLYLTGQLMILFIPVLWLGINALSLMNVIFTLLFSGVYIYYYRLLN